MEIVTGFPAFFIDYVQHMSQFQLIEAAVVALLFGLAARRIGGAIILPIVSAVVFLVVDAVLPAVLDHAQVVIPALDLVLLQKVVALYVVFLVVSGVVFAIKRAILAIF